jgi:hypothetical protein
VRNNVLHSRTCRSYRTWAILSFLIVTSQVLGVMEKLWIRQWGQAYEAIGANASSLFSFASFATAEHQISLQGSLPSHHLHHFSNGVHYANLSMNANLPRAQDQPLFYVRIYAAIGLAIATASILSTITQYTGALRASRILFKRLLLGVVRATMRWHVSTTPSINSFTL